MNKKLFINFLTDKINISICFFLNTFLVVLFFYLSSSSHEILYPITISILLYIILMAVEWSRSYRFNRNLANTLKDINYDLNPMTNEQKAISKAVEHIHQNYINKISDLTEKNRSRQHFLSQWIHNLKTPVSVINLIIDRVSQDNRLLAEALPDIKEENNKLQENLENLLNLIRLDEFGRDYNPEVVDLAAHIKRIINIKKNQFIYSNVFPKLNFVQKEALVISDGKWNDFMLEQIISNAIKYSDASPQKAKNIYFNIEKTSSQTILTIKDEGIGIPRYDAPKIFEPFFTGENGRKHRNATGIGLYICSVIAEKLGNELDITSEKDKGTEVRITYLTKM